MTADRPHPPHRAARASSGPGPGRLNVLLSWGGWRTDSWADRVACLLEPMGVTSHRAATARQAEQVIRMHDVHIAVVDLGLPLDESRPDQEAGGRILELLRRMRCPPPTVIVSSPGNVREQSRDMSAALRVDAFAVVDRRSADVEFMLKVLQRAMERFYHGRWPCEHRPRTPSPDQPPPESHRRFPTSDRDRS